MVYDLPETRTFAEKTIKKFGLSDRIGFMDGNYVEGNIEGKYDAAWLSHVLHAESPEVCENMIQKNRVSTGARGESSWCMILF